MDDEIEFLRFVGETELWEVVGILGSRTAIERDRTKEWAERSVLKFSTGKFKILHLGWNNPEQ